MGTLGTREGQLMQPTLRTQENSWANHIRRSERLGKQLQRTAHSMWQLGGKASSWNGVGHEAHARLQGVKNQ